MSDSGKAHIIGLVAILFVLTGIVAAVLLSAREAEPEPGVADAEGAALEPGVLLNTLLGVGAEADLESAARPGFAAAGGGLAPQVLTQLAPGAAVASDGLLQYDELAAMLAADGVRPSFHLRISPVYAGTTVEERDIASGTPTAYVAKWVDTGSIVVSLDTPDAMIEAARDQIDALLDPGVAIERQALLDIGATFDDEVHLSLDFDILIDMPDPVPDVQLLDHLGLTLVEGDVYLAARGFLEDGLVPALPTYSVLVIGSDVQQTELTPNPIKTPIADWVELGGGIISLGSQQSQAQWLQPILDIQSTTYAGTTSAPNPQHRLLTFPNSLGWASYPDPPKTWDLEGGRDVLVTTGGDSVVTYGYGTPELGTGWILLTSHDMEIIAGALGDGEAVAFIENTMAFALNSTGAVPIIDVGPAVPTDRPVATASTVTYVDDGTLSRLRIEVWTW